MGLYFSYCSVVALVVGGGEVDDGDSKVVGDTCETEMHVLVGGGDDHAHQCLHFDLVADGQYSLRHTLAWLYHDGVELHLGIEGVG